MNTRKMNNFCKKKLNQPDLYSEIELKDITYPITVLLGPNGTGKSMSLRLIKETLTEQNIKFESYSTSRDDIVSRGSSPFKNWDPSKLICAFHSEGERMIDSFHDWANEEMLRLILKEPDKTIYILIDEADSGLSIDRIMQSIPQLVNITRMEHKRGRDIHVIFTCNSYELYECLKSDITQFIWVPTKEEISFNSYEEFKDPYLNYYRQIFEEVE